MFLLLLQPQKLFHQQEAYHKLLPVNTSGKAAAIDGIPAEFWKSNPYMAAEVIQPISEEAWLSEAFPEEWTDGIVVKMLKKGQSKDLW